MDSLLIRFIIYSENLNFLMFKDKKKTIWDEVEKTREKKMKNVWI